METILRILLLIISTSFIGWSSAYSNTGYYLCTAPGQLAGHTQSILGRHVNYVDLGVKALTESDKKLKGIFLALNFNNNPPQIEAHHTDSPFQSGFQVFRARHLEPVKQTNTIAVYRTIQQRSTYWPMISQSRRVLSDHLMPYGLNNAAFGKAYALVGHRVALIGYAGGVYSRGLAFCVKQDERNPMESWQVEEAFVHLMGDYERGIRNQFHSMEPVDVFSGEYKPLKDSVRESIVQSLDGYFKDSRYVFQSQYGNYLAMGTFLTGTGILAARLLMMKSNVATAIVPPQIIDDFLNIGKVILYTPEHESISFEELKIIFTENSTEDIIEMMKESPQLEVYLAHLYTIFYKQTHTGNEA